MKELSNWIPGTYYLKAPIITVKAPKAYQAMVMDKKLFFTRSNLPKFP